MINHTRSCPPSWIFEIQFFNGLRLRDLFCIRVPNFVKIGQIVEEISQFFCDFSRLWPPDFAKIQNFNGRSAVRDQCAPLYQISSKSVKRLQRYGDLTVFLKWRPSAILDLLGAYWDHPRRPLDGLHCRGVSITTPL